MLLPRAGRTAARGSLARSIKGPLAVRLFRREWEHRWPRSAKVIGPTSSLARASSAPTNSPKPRQMAADSDMKLPDALSRLGYATGEEIMRAMARQHGLAYVNLVRGGHPAVGRRAGARVRRPGKRDPSLGRERRRIDGDRQRSRGFRGFREAAVHPQSPDRDRPGAAREHPRSGQPLLRPDGGRKRRLDAPGVHRHRDRLHRDRGRWRGRRRRGRREQCPDRPARPSDDYRGRATSGVGHPYRAVRGSRSDPLSDRRRHGRAGQPPPTTPRRHPLQNQDSRQDSTLPSVAGPRTAGSRSPWARRNWTFG